MAHRRLSDRDKPYYVDRFENHMLIWIVLLLVLTIIDGVITLVLIDGQFEEANPAMRLLVRHGAAPFLIGKYVLTAWGLPILLVFKNYSIFHKRIRVGALIPTFVGLYILLIAYQVGLLWYAHHSPPLAVRATGPVAGASPPTGAGRAAPQKAKAAAAPSPDSERRQ
jgi:hypothetical protein